MPGHCAGSADKATGDGEAIASEKSNAGIPKKRSQLDTVCAPGKGVELLKQLAASGRI